MRIPDTTKLDALEGGERGHKVRVLRVLLPRIEDALARGVTRAQIVQWLQTEGISITPKYFETVLHRLRKATTNKAPNEYSQNHRNTKPPASPQIPQPPQLHNAAPEPSDDPWNGIDQIKNSTPDMKALARAFRRNQTKE